LCTYGFDLELGGRQATVTELYLRPHARRHGVGSRALAFLEEHLRQVGIGAYELQVESDNAEARTFYARMGLEPHDRIPLSKRLAAPR
jgi:GNAT superfamily N-acetyltransferase